MPKVAVLTGGGDAPGLNAAIRAVIRCASVEGYEVLGVRRGWKGLLNREFQPLSLERVDELLYRGGTILGSSRTNPYKEPNGARTIRETLSSEKIDALVAIGGEDTLGVAAKLHAEGMPVVGIPKTIDNDLNATQFTIGFATAVDIVTEAIDRLRTTSESHDRIMIVEIMGRHAGWLATYAGLAGGADAVLVPEFPMKLEELIAIIQKCRARGKNYSVIAVAEGAEVIDDRGKRLSSASEQPVDAFGHVQLGGIGDLLKEILKKKTGFDTRATILGHTQRGGSPCAADRILATAYGVHAMQLVKKREFGKMPALVNGRIASVPLNEAVAQLKTLTPDVYQLAQVFFG